MERLELTEHMTTLWMTLNDIRAKAALTLLPAPVSGASPGRVSSSTRPRGARSLPVRGLLELLGTAVSLLPQCDNSFC